MPLQNSLSIKRLLRSVGFALFALLPLQSSDTCAADCPAGGCRAEILGWQLADGPNERDNLHLDSDNIASLSVDWIVYSGCPGLGGAYFVIDGGAGDYATLDRSFSQYIQHIDAVPPDNVDGNQVHRSPLKYSSEFLLKHPCKHTVQLWAIPTSGNCSSPTHLPPVLSNEFTVWIDTPPPPPGINDPLDPFPGNPKTESSCSNGPPGPVEPTVGCPSTSPTGRCSTRWSIFGSMDRCPLSLSAGMTAGMPTTRGCWVMDGNTTG